MGFSVQNGVEFQVAFGTSGTLPNPAVRIALTATGEGTATGLARELNLLGHTGGTLLGEQHLLATASLAPSVTNASPISAAREILRHIQPDAFTASGSDVNDVWGLAMTPANYAITGVQDCEAPCNNGGFQAGQLRATASGGSGAAFIDVTSRVSALNGNGFLSYAVQVEEDIANAAALVIRDRDSESFPAGRLNALVESQLAASDIRARDARWQQEADARAGLVLRDASGNRVRVQQYVYRDTLEGTHEVRMTSIALSEAAGLNYLDLRVFFSSEFANGFTTQQVRSLPWNAIFTLGYARFATDPDTGCVNTGCRIASLNPHSSSPLLSKLQVEMGNGAGDFIRETINLSSNSALKDFYDFAGNPIKLNADGQRAIDWTLDVRKAGQAAQSFTSVGDVFVLAGSTLDTGNQIPSGEFRVIPRQYLSQGLVGPIPSAPADRPDYFHYVANDAGTIRHYPVHFAVVGDATSTLNTGLRVSTCGSGGTSLCSSLKFDNIWAAFRVNQPAGSQALPTLDIGENVLQITAQNVFEAQSPLLLPITTFTIPWTRMIWRGEGVPGFLNELLSQPGGV